MTAASRRRIEQALGAGTLLLLVALVEGLVRTGHVNAALVPAPSIVLRHVATIVSGGGFIQPLMHTLYLLAIAYVAGCLLAIALGLAMGRSCRLHRLFEPLVEVLRPLPKPALLPPLILFLGLGDAMKLTVIGLGVFFPVLINTIQGVRGADPVLIDAGRTFQQTRAAILWKIVLPSATPLILAGMRVSLGIGLVLVVVAEMMAGTGGIGYLIVDMQRSFRIPDMYAWSLILAVLGYALNELFVLAERRLTWWSGSPGP